MISLFNADKTCAEISAAVGRTQSAVQCFLRRRGMHFKNKRQWTDEKADRLRSLWVMGYGPTAISKMIGKTPDSISAKARDLGLPPSSYPATRASAPARAYTSPPPRPPVNPDMWLTTLTSRPWMDRERGECDFPLGDKGAVHSCCNPVAGGDHYCTHHRAVCGGGKRVGYAAAAASGRGRPSIFDRALAA
jgi:hypothetical protein